MIATKTILHTQELLSVLLVFIANSDSNWFTINGETSRDISLCCRLGFYNPTEYHMFFVHAGLAGYGINKQKSRKAISKTISKIHNNDISANVCSLA